MIYCDLYILHAHKPNKKTQKILLNFTLYLNFILVNAPFRS